MKAESSVGRSFRFKHNAPLRRDRLKTNLPLLVVIRYIFSRNKHTRSRRPGHCL